MATKFLIPKEDTGQKIKTGYTVYSFGLQDGLKATDFNLHSVCIDNNNHIWWGTGKAVTSLDLNSDFRITDTPLLHLNYLEVNERFYDYRNLPDSIRKKIRFETVPPFCNYPTSLKLSHDLNHLSFHFSAIDWQAPYKLKYSYRLIGLDETWSKFDAEAKAEIESLRQKSGILLPSGVRLLHHGDGGGRDASHEFYSWTIFSSSQVTPPRMKEAYIVKGYLDLPLENSVRLLKVSAQGEDFSDAIQAMASNWETNGYGFSSTLVRTKRGDYVHIRQGKLK